MPDPERIATRLQALWDIRRGPAGGADRPAFSPAEAEAMRLVAGWAREAGLEPGVDRFGNLWALPAGWTGPLVTSGSHVDTVPDGGRYDGALGTVLGLEVAEAFGSTQTRGGARAALLVCAAEEAPRFGAGTVGSRLLVGTLDVADLQEMRDASGTTAGDALAAFLEALSDLPRIDPPLPRLRAHAEVHVATRSSVRTLGIVTHVASPRRFRIVVDGVPGHAGEVSMEDRRDALAAAAEVTLAIEAAARAEPVQTVATVGTLEVVPGAMSVVPGQARLGVDTRGIDPASLRRLDGAIREAVARIAAARGVRASVEVLRAGEPVALDRGLVAAAIAAARRRGVPAEETWSGAGHDTQHLASVAPSLLVFVPLHGGESHTPQEGADTGEILQALDVVTAVLADSGA